MSNPIRRGNDFWGPALWNNIHSFALCYSPTAENKQSFLMFLESLKNLLPCTYCRVHYKQNLQALPPDAYFGSSDDLFKWTWQLHNIVNKQLGKPEVSLEWAKNYYSNRLFKSKYGGSVEGFTIDYNY